MADFIQLVKERQSASNFLPDHSMTKERLIEIFELVKLGLSAFDLQYTNYLTVIVPNIKEKLKSSAYEQYKVTNSSSV